MNKNETRRLLFFSSAVLALTLLYFFNDARLPGFFPRCPFNLFTGFYCPGCGSQRAVSSLLHADFLQAIHFNLLLVISLPLVVYSATVSLLNAIGERQYIQHIFYSPGFTKIVLVFVIAFWILRNIPVHPFVLLAPHSC